MALNYDLTKIKNSDTICWREITKTELEKEKKEKEKEKKSGFIKINMFGGSRFTEEDGKVKEMNTETTMLIHLMGLFVGIGEITQKNYHQVYSRIKLWEDLNGAFLRLDNKPYKYTEDMIKSHIGLTTNSSLKTPAQFKKNCLKAYSNCNKLTF